MTAVISWYWCLAKSHLEMIVTCPAAHRTRVFLPMIWNKHNTHRRASSWPPETKPKDLKPETHCTRSKKGHMLLLWRRSHALIMKKVTCSYYEEGHMLLLWRRSHALIMKKVTCSYYEEGHMLLLWRRSHALIKKKVTCSYYEEGHMLLLCNWRACTDSLWLYWVLICVRTL